jgi:hypothetical protein
MHLFPREEYVGDIDLHRIKLDADAWTDADGEVGIDDVHYEKNDADILAEAKAFVTQNWETEPKIKAFT